jgi:hypothetical protein
LDGRKGTANSPEDVKGKALNFSKSTQVAAGLSAFAKKCQSAMFSLAVLRISSVRFYIILLTYCGYKP